MSSSLKPCPYCLELIQTGARKCRYCMEMLPDGWSGASSAVTVTRPIETNAALAQPKHKSGSAPGRPQSSVGSGILWMFGISILLCFLPVLGPFIAGMVGGKKSGGILNAIMAALLPSLVLASLLLTLTSSIAGIPIIGVLATWGSIAVAFAGGGPLLVGAIIGGLFVAGQGEPVSKPAFVVVLVLSCLIGARICWQINTTIRQVHNAASEVSSFSDAASKTAQKAIPSFLERTRQTANSAVNRIGEATKDLAAPQADEAVTQPETIASSSSLPPYGGNDSPKQKASFSAETPPAGQSSENPERSEPYDIGNGVRPPTVLTQSLPSYTEEGRKARAEGIVFIQAVVRKDGTADDLKVLKGIGYGLDESAVDAIKTKWRFQPGTYNGKPVDVIIKFEINFRLK